MMRVVQSYADAAAAYPDFAHPVDLVWTRESELVRRGASIRAAISMVELAVQLGGDEEALDLAATVTLPNRIELKDEGPGNSDVFIAQLLEAQKKS